MSYLAILLRAALKVKTMARGILVGEQSAPPSQTSDDCGKGPLRAITCLNIWPSQHVCKNVRSDFCLSVCRSFSGVYFDKNEPADEVASGARQTLCGFLKSAAVHQPKV